MSHINENIFQDYCKISQDVQKISQRVANDPVNPHTRKTLFQELETLQDSIEQLRQGAKSTQEQFARLESQVISLYREIEDRFEDYEISLISKEALDLGANLEGGKMVKIAKQINSLQHNIIFLFEHRRPSLKNRKIVHLAVKLMDYANAALSLKGETPKEQIKLIHLLRLLLQEAVLRIGMADDPAEQELSMELYEIADLFYRKEKNEALMRLNLIRSQLSRAQQNRLDSVGSDPEELISALLELADGDPCLEWSASAII